MSNQGAIIWRLICNPEGGIYVFTTRLEDEGPPTLCPNDHANRSDITDVRQVGSIDPQSTTVLEPTTGTFEVKEWKWAIPAGPTGTVTDNFIQMPVTIEVWRTAVDIRADMLGDQLSICVAPGAVIGLLTAAVSSGTVLDVPQLTVYNNNVNVGAIIELHDPLGPTTQELGYLTLIDRVNFQLNVQFPVANSFPIGTQVRMYNYLIRDYEFSSVEYRTFGDKGFKSRLIPANVPIRISYRNNDAMAKDFFMFAELYKS